MKEVEEKWSRGKWMVCRRGGSWKAEARRLRDVGGGLEAGKSERKKALPIRTCVEGRKIANNEAGVL